MLSRVAAQEKREKERAEESNLLHQNPRDGQANVGKLKTGGHDTEMFRPLGRVAAPQIAKRIFIVILPEA